MGSQRVSRAVAAYVLAAVSALLTLTPAPGGRPWVRFRLPPTPEGEAP